MIKSEKILVAVAAVMVAIGLLTNPIFAETNPLKTVGQWKYVETTDEFTGKITREYKNSTVSGSKTYGQLTLKVDDTEIFEFMKQSIKDSNIILQTITLPEPLGYTLSLRGKDHLGCRRRHCTKQVEYLIDGEYSKSEASYYPYLPFSELDQKAEEDIITSAGKIMKLRFYASEVYEFNITGVDQILKDIEAARASGEL